MIEQCCLMVKNHRRCRRYLISQNLCWEKPWCQLRKLHPASLPFRLPHLIKQWNYILFISLPSSIPFNPTNVTISNRVDFYKLLLWLSSWSQLNKGKRSLSSMYFMQLWELDQSFKGLALLIGDQNSPPHDPTLFLVFPLIF